MVIRISTVTCRYSFHPLPLRSFHSTATASASATPSPSLTIIGGGLSGLSAAFFFLKALNPAIRSNVKVTVLEKNDRVGGWCKSVSINPTPTTTTQDSIIFETGPRSIRPVGLSGWLTINMVCPSLSLSWCTLPDSNHLNIQAHTLNLTRSILTVSKSSPAAKNRYIYYPDKLSLLPSSLSTALTSSVIRPTIPGILKEPFVSKSFLDDESIDSFFKRRFGTFMAENLISSMIHGIYAGDTRKLSMKGIFPGIWEIEKESRSLILGGLFGKLIRGIKGGDESTFRRKLRLEDVEKEKIVKNLSEVDEELVKRMMEASVWGLKGGIETLTKELRTWLELNGVEFKFGDHGDVKSIAYSKEFWTVRLSSPSPFPPRRKNPNLYLKLQIKTPKSTLTSTHLITTFPSLVAPSLPQPLQSVLTSIPSVSVSVINLSFPSPSPPEPPLFQSGFGYLIPRTIKKDKNPFGALGVIFDSTVMPSLDPFPSPTSSATPPPLPQTKISLLLGGSHWLSPNPLPNPFPPSPSTLLSAALTTLSLHFPNKTFPPPSNILTSTHINCIPQLPVGHPILLQKVDKALKELNRVGTAKIGVLGGGTGVVGINGAVLGGWEVGTGFAKDIEGVKEEVKTGLERWED